MGTYIHFTDEQKERANSVDLEEFLRRRGEKLLRSGREFRLDRRHRITVRGGEWYDHAACQGRVVKQMRFRENGGGSSNSYRLKRLK